MDKGYVSKQNLSM